jgi:hypothetical protein
LANCAGAGFGVSITLGRSLADLIEAVPQLPDDGLEFQR